MFIMNWIQGRAWGIGCESRWTHVNSLLIRFLVSCLPAEALPRGLNNLRISWDIRVGLEATLLAVLATNPDDWASRGKLRLLRVCKNLCVHGVSWILAVMYVGWRPASRILDAIFGAGDRRKRIDLPSLASNDPSLSPVLCAHEVYWGLLSNWSGDYPPFALLSALHVDFGSGDLRIKARAHFMKMDAGIANYFSDRLARPPYSLWAMMMDDDDSHEISEAALDDLLSIPFECLPILCRKWRMRFPSKAALRSPCGRMAVWSWIASVDVAMDFTERSHNQMRTDLSTTSKGKAWHRCVDRMWCKQLHNKHAASGGAPASLTTVLSVEQEEQRAPTGVDAHSAGSSASSTTNAGYTSPVAGASTGHPHPSKHPGSYYIRFRALRVASWKRDHAPERSLTPDETAMLEGKCLVEWDDMPDTPEGRGAYGDLARAVKRQKLVQALVVPPSDAQSQPFTGLWQSSSRKDAPLSIEGLANFVTTPEGQEASRDRRPEDNADVETLEPLMCTRCESVPSDPALVLGCYNLRKGVCRKHLTVGGEARALDTITSMLSRWVDTLPRESCDTLTAPALLFRNLSLLVPCTGVAGPLERDIVVTLQDNYWQPKVQRFVVCAISMDRRPRFFLSDA